MAPDDWKPIELGTGQIDWQARQIAAEIRRDMPKTFGEAIELFGPLQITHIYRREPNSDGYWIQLCFLTSLKQKPDVFFIGIDYQVPIFRRWIERDVMEGGVCLLPQPVEISAVPEKVPWLTAEGDIIIAHPENPFAHEITRLCNLADLDLRIH